MFTRIVECQTRPGKQEELTEKLRHEVLAILQRQPGFVDLITLHDDADEERVVCLSFWKTREDAENYHRNYYSQIVSTLKSLLTSTPELEIFQVDDSTVHRIAARKAA